MIFQIKSVIVGALGLHKDIDYFDRDFPSREEAVKWCKESQDAAHNTFWGDGIYYSVEEEKK